MKKKIIGFLLLGAFIASSTSMFVSCKDYDDDVSDLQSQINSLSEQVTTKETTINSAIATLQATLENLQGVQNTLQDDMSTGDAATLIAAIAAVDAAKAELSATIVSKDDIDAKNTAQDQAIIAAQTSADQALAQLGELIAAFTALSRGENATQGLEAIQEAVASITQMKTDITQVKNDLASLSAKYNSLDEKLTKAIEEIATLKTAIAGQQAALEALAGESGDMTQIAANIASLLNKVSELEKQVGESTGEKTIAEQIEALNKLVEELEKKIGSSSNPEVNTLSVALAKDLRSLVFKPRFYYQGIEAFEVATFKYKPLTLKAVNADGAFSTDKANEASSYFMMAPDMKAEYYLNPSNAKVNVAPEAWSIVAYNLETRAASNDISSNFKVSKVEVADGIATLHSHYNGDVIKDIATDKQVTTLAVQYAQGDTVITSDYAALQATQYKDLVLNNAKVLGSSTATPAAHKHLYTTASDAISNDAQIEVVYNNDKGIDLREYINTHRTYVKSDGTEDKDKKWDDNAAKGTVENDGFKYSFELVGYQLGDNKTSQSAHAAINNDGYTLRPQGTLEGKQQPYGYTQTKEIIGRMPLVRVALTDTINNKVAAVGYIKVKIVDNGPDPVLYLYYIESFPTTTDEGKLIYANNTYTLHCDDDSKTLKTLAWHEVEEKLMAKVNMDKATFEVNYELDGSVSDADQFSHSVNSNGEDVWTSLTDKVGKVERTTADVDGSMTEVVKWTIKENQLYDIFVYNNKSAVETWVRYKRKGSGPVDYFYIQFIWTPDAINKTPKSAFGDGNKNPVAWYQKADVETKATAGHFDEIHGNVEVPGTNVAIDASSTITKTDAANDEFVFDIKSTLVGNKFSIDAISDYPGLRTPKVTARFISGNGLYANPAGDKVYAESGLSNLVASIDPNTGVVRYEHGTKAEELLNAAGRDELTKNVRARVQVTAKACEGTGIVSSAKSDWGISDGINIPVENSEFDVVFLRPINPNQASVSDFVDAETGGSLRSISIGFSDWRGTTVESSLFNYYGISELSIDFSNAWTDQTGTLKKLSSVNPNLKLSYVDISDNKHSANSNVTQSINYGNYGKILYENTGVTVGEFYIYIPYEISYDWGKFKSGTAQGDINKMIKCYVKKTM